MKNVNVTDLLRTREINLHNDRIAQISDHLWRATKDFSYTVRKYNNEHDDSILHKEINELHLIITKLRNTVELIDTTINPF